jgi:hypothetical protein
VIGKIDAWHYRGGPVGNPGLPSYIERTVNDKISGSLAYPILLTNSQSVIGTASVYASHDEDRYHNEQRRADRLALASACDAAAGRLHPRANRPGEPREYQQRRSTFWATRICPARTLPILRSTS